MLTEDDIISASFGLYLKYSNIVECSTQKDKYNRFFIKKFDKFGYFIGTFCYTSDEIFREKEIIPYALKFNPEKVI